MYIIMQLRINVCFNITGGEVNVAVSSQLLAAGDTVRIELDVAVLKLMQEDHGGWNDSIASVSRQALIKLFFRF